MATGIENLIIILREAGFTYVLLWLLTLSIVYGLLTHAKMPSSVSVRAVISLTVAFLVLLAAASVQAIAFLQNIIVSSILIAFGLLFLVIFLEISQAKKEGSHVIGMHPKIFGVAILILFVAVFVGAGGMEILNIPALRLNDTALALGLFAIVAIGSIWVMWKETGGGEKKE